MKIVQSFISHGIGWQTDKSWMSKVDELVTSALQWKYVFPEDTLHLYVGPGENGYISRNFSNFERSLWDTVTVLTEGSQTFDQFNQLPYTGGRFWAILQQSEPVLFLDQDTFAWPELAQDSDFQEIRAGKYVAGFIDELNFFSKVVPEDWNMITAKLGYDKSLSRDFYEGTCINSGILYYNPVLQDTIRVILECQKEYSRVWQRSPELLEIIDGGILLETVKQFNLSYKFISSPYIIHYLGDYRVPVYFAPESRGYGYTDEHNITLLQRKHAWKSVFKYMRKEQRGLDTQKFTRLFEDYLYSRRKLV